MFNVLYSITVCNDFIDILMNQIIFNWLYNVSISMFYTVFKRRSLFLHALVVMAFFNSVYLIILISSSSIELLNLSHNTDTIPTHP